MRKVIKIPLLLLLMFFFCILGGQPDAYAQQPTASDSVQTEKTASGKMPITQSDYNNSEIEMADAWRANGKIYVVVATISSLLIGLVIFLIFLERRIGKLEQEVAENKEG